MKRGVRIGFAPRTPLSQLVDLYMRRGDPCSALIITYLAVTKRCMWYGHMIELCRRVLGVEPSRSKVQSHLITWKVHKIVEPCNRGSYRIGPGVDASPEEVKKAIEMLLSVAPQVLQVEEIRAAYEHHSESTAIEKCIENLSYSPDAVTECVAKKSSM